MKETAEEGPGRSRGRIPLRDRRTKGFGLVIGLAFTLLSGAPPSKAEDVCSITNIDAFLDKCPTTDPAVLQILKDFVITRDGVPVDLSALTCTEPVSALPTSIYNNELALLQTLRTVYYLDRYRCGHLPWTPLALYEWLRSKVGAFNIDSAAGFNSCCSTSPGGRPVMTLQVSDAANLQYHQTWEGLGEFLVLLMHEARHVDGYGHVSCCTCCTPPTGACDPAYDESNLSPYGIQYFLERAFVDGTIHTGYTCLSPTRTAAIKSWFRNGANDRLDRFCSSPPPLLTDANNPPPPCESSCATSVTCVGAAHGVPPSGGPPDWWGPPPQPVTHDRLDDARWVGAARISYGDGTGEKAELRALQDGTYVYLSWRAFVAPASVPAQNALYFGYRRAGGGDVIVKASLTDLSAVTDDPTHLLLEGFLRQADGTQGATVALPPEIAATARVWVEPTSPGAWALQLRMPLAAFATACGRFRLWYQLLSGTPTLPVASYTWPRSGAEIDGGTTASPHPPIYPDPALWAWFRPSTGAGDASCTAGGVSIEWMNVGTKNSPASQIRYSSAAPFPSNTLFARPTNGTNAEIPAGAITATFRLANWGSVPGDWEAGVSADELWATIPNGANIPTTGPIPPAQVSAETSEAHFDWTVTGADLSRFVSGERLDHQCMLVELRSFGSPGAVFTQSSVYRNMDFVTASTFRRDALLSVKGLPPVSPAPRNVYVYVETQRMPAKAGRDAPATARQPAPVEAKIVRQPALYRVHVYHDTGKVMSVGGVSRPVLRYDTSFGYTVRHDGELEGWRHSLRGSGLVELAPNWYLIPVPNQGSATVTTEIEALEPSLWSIGFHLGPNAPVGASSSRFDGRLGGGLDLERSITPVLSLDLFAALDGLSGQAGVADETVFQLSVSGRTYLATGSVRPFLLAGAGAFHLNPGGWEAGLLAGAGLQVKIAPRLALEGTFRVNKVVTGPELLQFLAAHLGLRLTL